jgi:PAS domain S-box-containing protein
MKSAAEQTPRRVLYINSYHRGFTWSDGIEQGLRDQFKKSNQNIDLYIESLDAKRFPDVNYLSILADAFINKYSKIVYDAIVVSDNPAFDFAVKYREQMFPSAPLIFCGYNSFRPEIIKDMKNITGVNEEIDFFGTIEMALSISPQTKKLVFITSDFYSTGKRNQETVENTLIPAYQNRYQIIQLKNLYLQELEKQLAALASDSLVFIFGSPIDNREDKFTKVEDYYRRQAAASPVPTYSFWDFTLNTGIMGGRIITRQDQGQVAAELALRIFNGTPADQIPVIMETPTSKIFDFNAMRRFKILETSLPKESIIINKPDSFYQQNKIYIWIAIVTIIILIILSSILSILLRRSRHLGNILLREVSERQKTENLLQLHYEQLEKAVEERTTEIKHINETLKEREALFHGMFDSHSAVMFLLNPETGFFIEANQAALNYYGYSLDEWKELKIYNINQLTKEEIKQEIAQAKAEQRKYFIFRHRLANGQVRDVEVHSTPVLFKRQTLLFSIVHDITERKQMDTALKAREIELNELNVTKDRLFSIIAHDLRSPFNAILSFSEYLLENLTTETVEESKELVKDIHLAANSTFKLLNNLLDWARTQTNQIKIYLEQVNISLNINEVLDDLQPVALNKNITLYYLNPQTNIAYVDQNMLNTILRNLISNSIKYTDIGGKIEVSVENKSDYLEIAVADNGVGMNEETKNRLFVSNVNQSTFGTHQEKGTGLGLIICKEFVKKLKGEIWVESEINHGSIFKFTLPVALK